MKNHILIIVACLIAQLSVAQNTRYLATMEKNLTQLDSVKSLDDLQKVANVFERISNAEQEEWLPAYYFAYCQLRMASMVMGDGNSEKVEAHVDKAQTAMDHCKALAPDNSEVVALQGYVYTARIWVNPMTSGAKYSPLAMEAYNKAIALNEQNPRAYYLRGQHIFFTPAFWGGGAKNAYTDLKAAAEYFEKETTSSSIHPNWGTGNNAYLLAKAEAETSGTASEEK